MNLFCFVLITCEVLFCFCRYLPDLSFSMAFFHCCILVPLQTNNKVTDVITVHIGKKNSYVLVSSESQLCRFWTYLFLVEILWMVKNFLCKPEWNLFPVGGKRVSLTWLLPPPTHLQLPSLSGSDEPATHVRPCWAHLSGWNKLNLSKGEKQRKEKLCFYFSITNITSCPSVWPAPKSQHSLIQLREPPPTIAHQWWVYHSFCLTMHFHWKLR